MACPVFAEPGEMRTWTSVSGAKIEARLVEQNSFNVVLEQEDGKKLKIALQKISKADRKYIEMLEVKEYETEPAPPEQYAVPLGKTSAEIKCEKDAQWSYYIFMPPNFNLSRKWPVMFIMSPGGGGVGNINNYMEGAKKNGWILAVSVQSKNGFKQAGDAMIAMVDDVCSRHPVDEKRIYSSGFSGGARMAFSLAEHLKGNPHAGVLACGAGGLGSDMSEETVVYGICGSNCFNRWDMACTMKELKNKSSRLWFFPAGHAWAGSDLLTDGTCWLNGCYLKEVKKTDKLLTAERHRYAMMMLEHIGSMIEKDPERAYRMGAFMEGFGIQSYLKEDLKAHMDKLRGMPAIQNYVKAEAEMYELVNKYYATNVMDYKNNNCPPALTKDADTLAEKYKDLKLTETVKKMGAASVMP